MTTYDANMTADKQIPMPELFKFTRGAGAGVTSWYYTSYKTDIIFLSNVYVSAAIERSQFVVDSSLAVTSVTITASILDEFGSYIGSQPTEKTKVVIYRAVSDDLSKYVTLFDGSLISIGFNEENAAQARCDQKASILDRELGMIYHSTTCNHHVFNGGCTLDKLNWREVVVVGVSGSTLTASVFGTYADGYFTGGQVKYGGDSRLITNHVGTALTLHVPFDASLTTGKEVEAIPGCNGLASTCVDKYDNLDDFLGCPYIPSKNPAIWGV